MEHRDGHLAEHLRQLHDDQPDDPEAAAERAENDRPWCGAPRELGGQQQCPIVDPCPAGTCAIGRPAWRAEPEILPAWPCHDCAAGFDSRPDLLDHAADVHGYVIERDAWEGR